MGYNSAALEPSSLAHRGPLDLGRHGRDRWLARAGARHGGKPITLADQLARAIRQWNAQQARSALPYVPFLAAGFNARPWRDKRPAFAFPTRGEFAVELRQVAADLEVQPNFGLPLPGGGRQKMLTIYAWNEFGEGGIVAPTRGEDYSKLEAIRDLFPENPETNTTTQP